MKLRVCICVGAALIVSGMGEADSAKATRLCGETRETFYTNVCEKVYGYNTATTISLAVNTTTTFAPLNGETIVSCKWASMPGNISSPGGEYQQWVIIKNSSLTFSNCSSTVSTLESGSLAIEYQSGSNPKVFALNQSIELSMYGIKCVYHVPAWTHMGYWQQWGSFPQISIAGQSIWEGNLQLKAGTFLCPSKLNWSGTFEVIGPYGVEVIK